MFRALRILSREVSADSRARLFAIRIRVVAAVAIALSLAFLSWYAIKAEAQPGPPRQNQSGVPSPQIPADLVLTNGIISTMDENHPRASMIAIRGESIIAVAYNISDAVKSEQAAEVQALIGPNTRVIDLGGKFAMPGFNDAHIHLFGAAYAKLQIDFTGVKSIADHAAIANSRALKIAGVTRATPDPPGGHIERDASSGEPTGMLEESAMSLVYGRIPRYSMEQRRRAFQLVMDEAVQYGVTSVQDNSVMDADDAANCGWQNFLVLDQLKREGKLKFHVTEWLPFLAPVSRLEEMRRFGGSSTPENPGDPWLKTGQVKLIMDGSLGSRTAAMLAPYSDDPSTSGILEIEPDRLKQMAIERDRAGF